MGTRRRAPERPSRGWSVRDAPRLREVVSLDGDEIAPIAWEDVPAVQVTRSFLTDRDYWLKRLLSGDWRAGAVGTPARTIHAALEALCDEIGRRYGG